MGKKRILIVFGRGGHTTQMIRLLDLLKGNKNKAKQYDYFCFGSHEDKFIEDLQCKNIYRVTAPWLMYDDNLMMSFIKGIQCTIDSFLVFLKLRPDVVICCGPRIAVPISLICKLFGKKVIFIETWSRIVDLSKTGKLLYRVADLTFVQWSELQSKYPKAIYAGRLG